MRGVSLENKWFWWYVQVHEDCERIASGTSIIQDMESALAIVKMDSDSTEDMRTKTPDGEKEACANDSSMGS